MPDRPSAMRSVAATPVPFFLDSVGGQLFALHNAPAAVRGHVLFVPPFNEEMNRCRSMVTLQGAAFAAAGFGMLTIDLFGTGDSAGEHLDCRWDTWLANIDSAFAWLSAHGRCCALMGIRNGAMLAAEWLHTRAPANRPALLAWQPVTDGSHYLTQFLRMRIAANMDRRDQPRESTAMMREGFARGEAVEVAGYEIHPELARAMDARRLADFPPPPGTEVAWLEKNSLDAEVPAAASAQVIATWQAAGLDPAVMGFDGQAIWQLHERALAPHAIQLSTAWLSSRTPQA